MGDSQDNETEWNLVNKRKRNTNSPQNENPQKKPNNEAAPSSTSRITNKLKNASEKMRTIFQQKYNSLFYFDTTQKMNRAEIAELWENAIPNNRDIILETKKGFLLKSNTTKTILQETLKK
ncbi:unnamed protein product [Ceutorhynchus assimilis]|uniref:Uncharacterized protein n=1 Tax=Ceutorhynchus assimilis TaxID=467358 RepID=A0A9N9MK90_9CUCU|nr:unnamed protein product [Ceutorhynchus assimilis]